MENKIGIIIKNHNIKKLTNSFIHSSYISLPLSFEVIDGMRVMDCLAELFVLFVDKDKRLD